MSHFKEYFPNHKIMMPPITTLFGIQNKEKQKLDLCLMKVCLGIDIHYFILFQSKTIFAQTKYTPHFKNLMTQGTDLSL